MKVTVYKVFLGLTQFASMTGRKDCPGAEKELVCVTK